MPQMNKGGKFILGKSLIRTDGTLRIPPQAMEEYHIADEGKVYLFTGSKITGGFCVTRKGLLHPSKLGHILDDTPPLLDYSAGSGEFIKYKGAFLLLGRDFTGGANSSYEENDGFFEGETRNGAALYPQ